jgi:SAM-dependent methyltransferase
MKKIVMSVTKGAVAGLLNRFPRIWDEFVVLYNSRAKYRGLAGIHPIDRIYSIETGQSIPGWLLGSGGANDQFNTAYAGCQPSCLRAALSSIPLDELDATFIDLGCGKGRALFVATEYDFKDIVGVELSKHLCRRAEMNVASCRPAKANMRKPRIVHQDVTQYSFPSKNVVFFLCHSFGVPVLDCVLDNIEKLAAGGHEIFFIYENPVHGQRIDMRGGFRRWYAATVEAEAEELPFHTGSRAEGKESVVVWHTGSIRSERESSAFSRIVLEEENWRATIMP